MFRLPLITCLLLANTLFLGCSRDNTPAVPLSPAGEITLDLHENFIKIWSTLSFSFSALSIGEFSIEARDTAIATVKVDGNKFTVKAGEPGETMLTITDDTGKKTEVAFCSYTFSRGWREGETLNDNNSINIVTENEEVKATIHAKLASLARRERTYYFNPDDGTFSLVNYPEGDVINGTFSWGERTNHQLILNFNGQTEVYLGDLMPGALYAEKTGLPGDSRPFIFSLTQDFTGEFVREYPDAGIREVNITRYIHSTIDFWQVSKK
jgi:hypothetical protein